MDHIRVECAAVISIDGATSKSSRDVTNVIVFSPHNIFLEYLQRDLQRETSEHLAERLTDVLARLSVALGQPHNIVGFVSDSCNSMILLRKILVERNVVAYAYGCGAHALNNFSLDVLQLPQFSKLIKEVLWVAKTVKNTHMLRNLFDVVCVEKLCMHVALVLYSSTRWSSCNYMILRMLKVKPVMRKMLSILVSERDEYKLDDTYECPDELQRLISSVPFWKEQASVAEILTPICRCLGLLESDYTGMSVAHAAFVYFLVNIRSEQRLPQNERDLLEVALLRRWKRIYSPVHALAFVCDPLFNSMRRNVGNTHGEDILTLGQGNLMGQCRSALYALARGDQVKGDLLLQQFMLFIYSPSHEMETLKYYQLGLIWAQFAGDYDVLAMELQQIFKGPASAAAVERHHKTGKRVTTNLRGRLGEGKIERQVAIAYNSA